jgi:hypothetical protein
MDINEKINKTLEKAIELGKYKISNGRAPAYTDSIVSEKFMVELLREAAESQGLDPNWIIHHGGHSFPDVSIKNSNIGIELKGSASSRRFNGNSVVASTMLPNLKKIYLFYWIGTTGELGFRNYFDCVSTPVVTHSPRFQLDIDLKPSQSMFGLASGKVGEIESVIFGLNGIDSNKIIKWMADNARLKGETPWWIAEDDSSPVGSTGLIKCTDLPFNRRRAFMKSAFLAFPKIFDRTSPNKYNGLFEWAVSVKSVLSSRDDYSAGGRIMISLPGFSSQKIEVPQVIQVAIESLTASDTVYLSELEGASGIKFKDAESFMKYYKANLPKYLTHIYQNVKKEGAGFGEADFAKILADEIVSKVDISTLR